MKIIEIDETTCPPQETVVLDKDISRPAACKELVDRAIAFQRRTPNEPYIDLTGERQLSVLIGLYKIRSWRIHYGERKIA